MAEFEIKMKMLMDRTERNLAAFVRESVIEIASRIVQRSPVGNPDLWGVNDVTMMNREMYQVWREQAGKKRVSGKTLSRKFKSKAPKGYVGGRFRGNWQYGNNRKPVGDLPDIDSSGASSMGRIETGVSTSPPFAVHYITNNLPYAMALERGHSSQAPQGIVGLVALEVNGIADSALEKIKSQGWK